MILKKYLCTLEYWSSLRGPKENPNQFRWHKDSWGDKDAKFGRDLTSHFLDS